MSSTVEPSTFHISLPQMLELAFGKPNTETINMSLLQNFLHIMLHLSGLNDTIIDYHGEAADKMKVLLSSSSIQSDTCDSIAINACGIRHINFENLQREDKTDVYFESCKTQREEITESSQDSDGSNVNNNTGNGSSTKSQKTAETRVKKHKNCEQSELVPVPRDKLKNKKIKRLSGGGDTEGEVTFLLEKVSQVESRIDVLDERISELRSQTSQFQDDGKSASNITAINTVVKSASHTSAMKSNMNNRNKVEKESIRGEQSNASLVNDQIEVDILGEVNCCKLRKDFRQMTTALSDVKQEICDLREKLYEAARLNECRDNDVDRSETEIQKCTVQNDGLDEKYLVIKQKQSNYKPTKCTDLISDVEESLKSMIQCIDDRMQCFEDYVHCALKNINDIISKNKSEEELLQYVKDLRLDLEAVKSDIVQLKYNEVQRNLQFEALTEEVCLLKTTKADQEAVQESLAEKADLCDLNKKVSHEEFEAICDDITRNLNELMAKFSQQESIWQQSLEELRCEFDGKIDNLEIPSLKDWINCQLSVILHQLKVLSQKEKEREASGARKVLRNLRCIVCNKDAYINTEAKNALGQTAFPCRVNNKPLITYKMNEVRQQGKKMLQEKNLLNLEKIMNRTGCKNDIDEMSHLCDRYCGGSHTIITAQQKLPKTKIDISQWDMQLVEGPVKGNDGRLYKGCWQEGQTKK